MLSDREKTALDHPRIAQVFKFHSEYRLDFLTDDGPVDIRLRIEESGEQFHLQQSKFIKTPLQPEPDLPQCNAVTPEDALDEAMQSLTTFFDMAVKTDLRPSATWFVPNPAF